MCFRQSRRGPHTVRHRQPCELRRSSERSSSGPVLARLSYFPPTKMHLRAARRWRTSGRARRLPGTCTTRRTYVPAEHLHTRSGLGLIVWLQRFILQGRHRFCSKNILQPGLRHRGRHSSIIGDDKAVHAYQQPNCSRNVFEPKQTVYQRSR